MKRRIYAAPAVKGLKQVTGSVEHVKPKHDIILLKNVKFYILLLTLWRI